MATRTFATFYLDDLLFGVDILMIREINKQLNITPVQHVPVYIRGLVNIRGQVVTVIDLKHILGLGDFKLTEDSHNIIFKTESEMPSFIRDQVEADSLLAVQDKLGWLVDCIGDIISVESDDIDPPPANIGSLDGKYLSGVVKLQNKLVAIIKAKKVLEALDVVEA